MKRYLKILAKVLLLTLALSSCQADKDSKLDKQSNIESESVISEDEDSISVGLDESDKKEDDSLDKSKAKKKSEGLFGSETYEAKLIMGGDILPHMPINEYAMAYGEDGELDYSRSFEDMKEFFKDYDFVIVNNEFSVNPNFELSGYPTFNSSADIYKGLKDMGVDLMTTANNHCLDTGIEGLESTIDAINEHGIENVGTRKTSNRKYYIKEINNIKIGILAYAESVNGFDYLLDTDETLFMVDRLDEDLIEEDIKNIRKEGAEFVIVWPHWGVEYQSYPEEYQIELAHAMIDWGADMVIGNHPHVIQPREMYETKDGRYGVIYYSVGNLLSNQKAPAFDGDYRVEQGILVQANIKKDKNSDRAYLDKTRFHTTVVDRTEDSYGYLDKTYVATSYLEDEEKMESLRAELIDLIKLGDSMNTETINTEIE